MPKPASSAGLTSAQVAERRRKGHQIVRSGGIKFVERTGNTRVPSQTYAKKYTVHPAGCNCPDHVNRDVKCKHMYAAEFSGKKPRASKRRWRI